LASTTLLAADKQIFIAPAMNHKMWENPATKRNIAQVKKDGAIIIEPESGDLACGETGSGRMAELDKIIAQVNDFFTEKTGKLSGKKAIVTAGATVEAIDPVRFISNYSSGKQGYEIAKELASNGAEVTLISGKTTLPPPENVKYIEISTADEMLAACTKALPADITVCAAAVADWKVKHYSNDKLKKTDSGEAVLELEKNEDILANLATSKKRPNLLIGFAAETGDLEKKAIAKLQKKKCDWILANDVSEGKVFGSDENEILFVSENTIHNWGRTTKQKIAQKLIQKVIAHFG
jgi:phosphopantothenoylcysteine decarboxylase / phosphopantothenate---cysteine ligase